MINVLVLGAGITGLSAAYHLSRLLPRASSRILLVERSPRVGGWLQSNTRKGVVPPLEAGPRTLRPTSLAIIELVCPIISIWNPFNLKEKDSSPQAPYVPRHRAQTSSSCSCPLHSLPAPHPPPCLLVISPCLASYHSPTARPPPRCPSRTTT